MLPFGSNHMGILSHHVYIYDIMISYVHIITLHTRKLLYSEILHTPHVEGGRKIEIGQERGREKERGRERVRTRERESMRTRAKERESERQSTTYTRDRAQHTPAREA